MKGIKTGGRAKGTPNRRSIELAERLEALNCDPVAGLVAIANDPATEPGLRARVLSDLLPFLYPRRKAIEHGAGEGASAIVIRWASAPPADAETTPAG